MVFQWKYTNIVIYGRHRRHRHPCGQVKSSQAGNFGPPKTEFAWREWRKMLGAKCRSSSESERKLHENMLATCSLMYIQLIFIAYHIKKCFWLQFNRSEPCWSSGCVINRQESGTKYRLSRCKHCIKTLPTSGRFRDDSGIFLAHKI